jgi:glycosyl transferase family 25
MKVYLINLDRAPERLEHFTTQAIARGFTFERIAAVDGRAPEFAARAKGIAQEGAFLGPNEIACAESHRKAWRAFLASDERYALVMEDDVVVSESFSDFLHENWLPADTDIVRLETFTLLTLFEGRPVARVAGRRLYRLRGHAWGAAAYVLSRQAALDLLKATEDLCEAVDVVMFWNCSPLFKERVIYQMIPAPAIQGMWLKEAKKEAWTKSSLEAERVAIRGVAAKPNGLRAYRTWRRIIYRLQRLRARLQGRLLSPVPFK